eukprot:TRINITY_DN3968_c0_g2_i1.p1 TRINITY_DN3968_c0_g2~~TRINITY_DN3968_c0_g2_i1.p1  ORF type:complete len:321 (-),score=59.12 TRINITY_DN3968_c0_g2_i1:8-970(-)
MVSTTTVAELAGEIVAMVEGIQDRVMQAKNDTSNMRLALQLETLRPQAVLYEKALVQEALENGSLRLTKTSKWLEAAHEEMRRSPALPNTVQGLHRYGIMKLIFPEVFGTPVYHTIPETMQLDRARVSHFRLELLKVAWSAAVLSIAQALAEKLSRMTISQASRKKLSVCVLSHLHSSDEKILEAVSDAVCTVVHDMCGEHNCTSLVATQLGAALSSVGMVPALFRERVGFVLWRVLSVGTISREYMLRRALDEVGPKLLELCEKVEKLVCLLYTSDAADDLLCVDLGGRRIIKKKNKTTYTNRIIIIEKKLKQKKRVTV